MVGESVLHVEQTHLRAVANETAKQTAKALLSREQIAAQLMKQLAGTMEGAEATAELAFDYADAFLRVMGRKAKEQQVETAGPVATEFDISMIYQNSNDATAASVPGLDQFRKANPEQRVHLLLGDGQSIIVIPPYDETTSRDGRDTLKVSPEPPEKSEQFQFINDGFSVQGDKIYVRLPLNAMMARMENPDSVCIMDLGPNQCMYTIPSHESMRNPESSKRNCCTISPSLITAEDLRTALVETGSLVPIVNKMDLSNAASRLNYLKDESTGFYRHNAEAIYNAVLSGVKKYDSVSGNQYGDWDTVTHAVGLIYEHAAAYLRGEEIEAKKR